MRAYQLMLRMQILITWNGTKILLSEKYNFKISYFDFQYFISFAIFFSEIG